MLLKNRLKRFSEMKIELGTKFSKHFAKQDDWDKEDVTEQLEKDFHRAVLEVIENYVIDEDGEGFVQDVLEKMGEEYNSFEDLTKKIDEFTDFGQIGIEVSTIKDFASKVKGRKE